MIKNVVAKNFKGRDLDIKLDEKTIVAGPNGSGKSAIIQALQIALEGQAGGEIHKTNQGIMDVFGAGAPSIYAEVTVTDNGISSRLGRQYDRKNGSVSQTIMVDRRKTDQKGFALAAAKIRAPRVVAIDEFLGLSPKAMISRMAALIGTDDLDQVAQKLEETKQELSRLQSRLREGEVFVSRSMEGIASLNLPPGTLPEIQAEISKMNADLDAARKDLAEAEAAAKLAETKKAQPQADQPPQRNPEAERQVQQAEQRLMDRVKDRPKLDPAESIRKIIRAIEELNCPACTGGFVLMVAKVELKKWEAR